MQQLAAQHVLLQCALAQSQALPQTGLLLSQSGFLQGTAFLHSER